MQNWFLILGDLMAIALITFIGFASHGEAGVSFLPRMLAMFVPLSIAWFPLALAQGLFQHDAGFSLKKLWRPALTGLFAAPLAAVLRGLILNAPVIPLFAVVLSVTSAFGMVVWRGLYLFSAGRLRK